MGLVIYVRYRGFLPSSSVCFYCFLGISILSEYNNYVLSRPSACLAYSIAFESYSAFVENNARLHDAFLSFRGIHLLLWPVLLVLLSVAPQIQIASRIVLTIFTCSERGPRCIVRVSCTRFRRLCSRCQFRALRFSRGGGITCEIGTCGG